MAVKSFAELELAKEVTGEELVETMKEYATKGAGIASHVVIALIERVELDAIQWLDMLRFAEFGEDMQDTLRHPKCADEYHKVFNRLNRGR